MSVTFWMIFTGKGPGALGREMGCSSECLLRLSAGPRNRASRLRRPRWVFVCLRTHAHRPSFSLHLLASPVFSPIVCPPSLSFFPPFKDQRGPRRVLHGIWRGFSSLSPKPGRPHPPPCKEPGPCEPHMIKQVWSRAWIPQRNPNVPAPGSGPARGK